MLKKGSSNEIDMTLKKKKKQKSLVFKTYHRPLLKITELQKWKLA
jgi:hypothetical protein